MKVLALIFGLSLTAAACSNADFGGGGSSGSKAQTPSKKEASKTSTKKETATDSDTATDLGTNETNTDKSTDTDSDTASDDPKPPVGPGSDLTLTINDTDSKLDSFQVKNFVSQQWLPLTWHQGVQQIAGACSPDSKTTLQLQMHAKGSIFSSGGDLQTGSCNAPLTQTSTTSVEVGVAPSCDKVKGRFTLSCSGSASLTVVP